MPNPLFQQLQQNNAPQTPMYPQSNDGGFKEMLRQFNQFRNTFRGDPKQTVDQLLASGQVSQQQLQQVSQLASQFLPFLPK